MGLAPPVSHAASSARQLAASGRGEAVAVAVAVVVAVAVDVTVAVACMGCAIVPPKSSKYPPTLTWLTGGVAWDGVPCKHINVLGPV